MRPRSPGGSCIPTMRQSWPSGDRRSFRPDSPASSRCASGAMTAGAAAIVASAAFGALFLVALTVAAALAYSIAGSGNAPLTSGLNDFMWALLVLSSFPRAMLIMASTFGLWRAGQISNALFTVGVTALLLVLLGGSTWMRSGFWAADGAYSRLVSPIIGLVWIVIVSRVVLTRSPATRAAW